VRIALDWEFTGWGAQAPDLTDFTPAGWGNDLQA
jgi:hypothetical protein